MGLIMIRNEDKFVVRIKEEDLEGDKVEGNKLQEFYFKTKFLKK